MQECRKCIWPLNLCKAKYSKHVQGSTTETRTSCFRDVGPWTCLMQKFKLATFNVLLCTRSGAKCTYDTLAFSWRFVKVLLLLFHLVLYLLFLLFLLLVSETNFNVQKAKRAERIKRRESTKWKSKRSTLVYFKNDDIIVWEFSRVTRTKNKETVTQAI